MGKKFSKSAAADQIRHLAFGKVNDAMKLVFMDGELRDNAIDGLDLTLVSEIKRGAKGEVEVKFFNRIALLELLSKLVEGVQEENSEAESFFTAMDRAAARLGDGDEI